MLVIREYLTKQSNLLKYPMMQMM